jgi:hypothetical protein
MRMKMLSSGEYFEVMASFSAPSEIAGPHGGYVCRYEVKPLGLIGSALGTNPFQAIRFAALQVRVKLVHRYPDLRLVQDDGEIVPIDYEEPA